MKRDILTVIKTLVVSLLLVVGASYASALWTPAPGGSPPNCPTSITDPNYREGCNPPINTGASFQSKTGGFDVANTFSAINGIFTGKVGIGTISPAEKLDVTGKIHATGDICTDAGGGKCLSSGGGSTALPGNPRYASLSAPVLVSYHSWGNRVGSNGVTNADTIQNYAYVPTNNVLQSGTKYAYILVTSGDSTGQRILKSGTSISSKCYNSGHDPINDPFMFKDLDGTARGNAVISRQGTFTYSPGTITSADGKTAQGVLIAKNTSSCSDAGKGDSRLYIYEASTLKSIMDAMYNETPVSVADIGQIYSSSPKISAYQYKDQP